MKEDDLRDRVFRTLQDFVDRRFYKMSGLSGTLGSEDWGERFKKFTRDSGVEWDAYLNKLDIKRVEHHLDRKVRRGHIRIRDPFMLGPNRRRDLEISLDTANKIMILGLP